MTKPLSRRYVPLETFQRHCDAHGWWRVVPGGLAVYDSTHDGFHELIVVAADDPRCNTTEVFEDDHASKIPGCTDYFEAKA